MRFSTTALLALPLLASAAESPFEQYKAKFQNFLGSFGAQAPLADKADAPADAAPSAATAKAAKGKNVVEPKKIETLTLDNWKDTLYGPVQPEATTPEEWLVLLSGRNKTCLGKCGRLEEAFDEAALKFASLPAAQSPHLGYVNCEDEGVLCNLWSTSAGAMWLFEMLPAPAPIEISTKRLNTTTVTSQDILDAYKATDKKEAGWRQFPADGYFHPFDGKLAQWGVAQPIAYVLWGLNAIPSWAMMLVISFASRAMMNRGVNNGMNRGAGAPGAPAAPRMAPPGDAL